MNRQSGFSFLEIMIVVIIMGIVATATMPNFSVTDPLKLDVAAQEVVDAIRYARNQALLTGSPRGFEQQSGTKLIRVFRADMASSPPTLVYDQYHPVTKKPYTIELDNHSFASTDSLGRVTSFRGACNQTGQIYFDGNGIPWCADPETVLLEQFDLTLSLGEFSRVVTLHGYIGRVTVQ